MDFSVTFARHFSRLVWLLLNEPANTDEQKATLRAMVTLSREGAVTILALDGALTANGSLLPSVIEGVAATSAQMAAHGLATISADPSASPAHLLGAARILAAMPVLGDGGAAAEARRQEQGITSVRFAARARSPLETPATSSQAIATPTGATAMPDATSTPAGLPDLDFGEVFDDPIAEAKSRATPKSSPTVPPPGTHGAGEGGMFAQFASARAATATPEQLMERLDAASDGSSVAALLDELVPLAEAAARDGKSAVASDIMFRIVQREPHVSDFDAKRAFVMALRRLAKPVPLKAVTTQLPHRPEKRDELVAILVRAGEDGADALIEQITNVAHQSDRRVYFDALVKLKSGVPALMHMLGDNRWFVARNAAELLGEMHAREAEKPLTELLRHEDDRVRRAARGALMRLGTAHALQSIEEALRDPSPQMRMEAAAALVTRKDGRAAQILIHALEVEKEDEVQGSFLLALGRIATPEAVQRLTHAAQGERGLFKKKPTAYRLAAIHALSEARTTEATEALKALKGEKDAEVRDAATFALGRIARNTQAIPRIDLPGDN